MKYLVLFMMMVAGAFGINDRYDYTDKAPLVALGKSNTEYISPTSGDAATAIQAAIDKGLSVANTTGNYDITIHLMPGNYYFGNTVHLYRSKGYKNISINIIGSGMETTKLWLADGANCDMFDCIIPEGGQTSVSFFGLSHLVIDGNYANNTSGNGLYFKDNEPTAGYGSFFDANIDHVMAIHFIEDGFHFENSWGYKITNCITEFCNQTGLYITGAQAYVTNHFSAYNSRAAIYTEANDSQFSGINIYKCLAYNFDSSSYGCFYIKSSGGVYNNINIIGFGSDGRASPTTQSGSVGLYIYSGSSNIFTSVRIAGIPTGKTLNAYNGKGIYIGTGQYNSFSGASIRYQYAEAIDVSGASYGNTFTGISASWGNSGEYYDWQRNNNTFVNVQMVQDVVAGTTTLKTEGVCGMTTAAGEIAATLPNGAYDGQTVKIYLQQRYSTYNAVITITSPPDVDHDTLTFDASYEYAVLKWDDSTSKWVILSNTCTAS